MDEVRDSWKQVASKVEALGLKLKLHLDQEADDSVEVPEEGEMQSAFDKFSSQVNDAFDAFGNAARDDAVKADVREIGDLLKEALTDTWRAVGAEISARSKPADGRGDDTGGDDAGDDASA